MTKNETISIAVTAHRPNRLYGYDIFSPGNLAIATRLRDHLLSYLNKGMRVHAISGMALGGDTIFALVVLKLKRQGYDITLESAIPCANQPSQWPQKSQEQWRRIVEQADKVTNVSSQPYAPYLMQKRNEYMVDNCDELIAVFDGSPGGTANCVKYATEKGVNIVRIDPNELLIHVRGDLLESDCDIIFHQANCQSVMGSGIAEQIKKKYPIAFEADKSSPLSPEEKLGSYSSTVAFNADKEVEIVNLYGQLYYGRGKQHTNYKALKSALYAFLESRPSLEGLKLGVPFKLGSGRGGGDWNEVKQILQSACHDFHISIYMYEL